MARGKQPRKAAAKAPASASPFDSIQQRSKHDVIGRKLRGTTQEREKSRTKAIAKRKQSLLREMQDMSKTNTFEDKRFGEADSSLDADEKMLQRFQLERARQYVKSSKAQKYNLEDEEDSLTHLGTKLSNVEDIDENELPREEEHTDESIDAETVKLSHFGGGALEQKDETGRKKTKQEIMHEIIMKSKLHKAEKQVQQVQQNDRLKELDETWSDIRSLLEFKESKKQQMETKLNNLLAKSRQEEDIFAEKPKDEIDPEDGDEFMVEARKLALDQRARAAERSKTPEEVAKEEKARLETLEKQRLSRMNNSVDSVESTEKGKSRKRDRKKQEKEKSQDKQGPTDDDLVENFVVDSKYKIGAYVPDEDKEDGDDDEGDLPASDQPMEDKSEEADPDGGLEDLLDGDGGGDDDGDGDGVGDGDGDSEGDLDGAHMLNNKSSATKTLKQALSKPVSKPVSTASNSSFSLGPSDELPFIFPAPKSYREFRGWLDVRPSNEHSVIIQRIRACNSISLGGDNKAKMEAFYEILLQHFDTLCAEAQSSPLHFSSKPRKKADDSTSLSNCVLDVVVRPLFEMSEENNRFAGNIAREKLSAIRTEIFQRLADDGNSDASSLFPHASHLLYFRIVGIIFPTSDFRHNVVTPSILLMCECLSRIPIQGCRDVTAGLFMCSLLLSFISLSHRVIPEVTVFLHSLLLTGFPSVFAPSSTSTVSASPDVIWTFRKCPPLWASLLASKDLKQSVSNALDLNTLVLSNVDPLFSSPSFRHSSLSLLFKLIRQTASIYSEGSVASFPEIFAPLQASLNRLSIAAARQGFPGSLQTQLKSLMDYLAKLTDTMTHNRRPLEQVLKPHTIRQFTPSFKEDYQPGQDLDPEKERAQLKKIAKKMKREKRGAMHELRKDASFIYQEKDRVENLRNEQKTQKLKQLMTDLQVQQSDTNMWYGKKDRKRKPNAKARTARPQKSDKKAKPGSKK